MYRNPESLPNIKRIDAKRGAKRQTHGWQVHFARGDKEWTKLFSDGVYRSKGEAQEAAIAFRDALKPKIPMSVPERGFLDKARSNTGYVGVSYTFSRRKTIENKPCFTVTVMQKSGEPINRKFLVEDEKNYEKILRKAVKWRDSVLKERQLSIESQYEG